MEREWPGAALSEPSEKIVLHIIEGPDLIIALQRAANGEDVDLLYAELYANSEEVDED